MPGGRRPVALVTIAVVYLFSLFLALGSFGNPFPFMGSFYGGLAGEIFVFADSMISLYIVLGVMKRQRLTFWLIIAYNLLDICNACVNLALLPTAEYARLAGGAVPADELRSSTIAATIFLVLLTAYVFSNRRHFTNTSPYLF